MPGPLTKGQPRAYRKRWRIVNARERAELRSVPIEVKWQQLQTLFAWGRQFAPTQTRDKEAEAVRKRWMRLRKALSG
jgi:hypothetical protein